MKFAHNRMLIPVIVSLLLAGCGKDAGDKSASPPTPPPTAAAPAATAAPAESAAQTQAAAPALTTEPAPSDAIGYKTVAEARAAVLKRDDVDTREDDGWLIVADHAAFGFWSFTPSDNAAYPAVVRRNIHEKDGVVSVSMSMLCEAQKSACDELSHQFDDINERMRADLQRQHDANKK